MNVLTSKKNDIRWFLFVVPALVFYMIFIIIPALSSIYYAFTDWSGGADYKFVGLNNFTEMFKDNMILTSFGNTALYSIFITIFQNIFGLFLALFMVKKLKGVNILRTMFFMPAIFSGLVLGYVWNFILEPNIGFVNNLLAALNLEFMQRPWLGDPFWARWMIIIEAIWQFSGYSMVIYIAGLQSIPLELYESASMDGVKGLKKFWYMTFPLIAPSFTINILLCTIGTLKTFDAVYALTGGGPGYATETIATMMYHLGFGGSGSRWGYGTAMAIVMFLAIMIVSIIQTTFLRKREVEM